MAKGKKQDEQAAAEPAAKKPERAEAFAVHIRNRISGAVERVEVENTSRQEADLAFAAALTRLDETQEVGRWNARKGRYTKTATAAGAKQATA